MQPIHIIALCLLDLQSANGSGQIDQSHVKETWDHMATKKPYGSGSYDLTDHVLQVGAFSGYGYGEALGLRANMSGQSDTSQAASKGNSVYMGFLGNGWLYSINYDRSWRTRSMGLSLSVGCAYLPDDPGGPQAAKFSLPVQVNIFHGHRSSMEHGAGLTYGSGWNATTARGGIHSEALHLFLKPMGYRYQRETGGLFIRASALLAVKLVEFNEAWALYESSGGGQEPNGLWFGVDLGYTFKRK